MFVGLMMLLVVEIGDWAMFEDVLDASACQIATIEGEKYLQITYSGSKNSVEVYLSRPDWAGQANWRGRGAVSFSPSGVAFHGDARFSATTTEFVRGEMVNKPSDEGSLKVTVDTALPLHDVARSEFVRVAGKDGELAAQVSLKGSAEAVSALRRCVDQRMARL